MKQVLYSTEFITEIEMITEQVKKLTEKMKKHNEFLINYFKEKNNETL
jgi:hypothetical protein